MYRNRRLEPKALLVPTVAVATPQAYAQTCLQTSAVCKLLFSLYVRLPHPHENAEPSAQAKP